MYDLGASGWQVQRSVTLYSSRGEEEAVRELEDVDFPDWRSLAGALPELIEGLLATPLPTDPSSGFEWRRETARLSRLSREHWP